MNSNGATRMSWTVLGANTIAFTVCFAAWMMYGVLIAYLFNNGVYRWDAAQMGWLIGIPVLSGSIFRLPLGVLTDRYGGRPVFATLLLCRAHAPREARTASGRPTPGSPGRAQALQGHIP